MKKILIMLLILIIVALASCKATAILDPNSQISENEKKTDTDSNIFLINQKVRRFYQWSIWAIIRNL